MNNRDSRVVAIVGAGRVFYRLKEAALLIGTTPNALSTLCNRADILVRTEGNRRDGYRHVYIAHPIPGITAFKYAKKRSPWCFHIAVQELIGGKPEIGMQTVVATVSPKKRRKVASEALNGTREE